ncbi:glycosyltransferase 87 family protein [Actinosynnema pretiosum]|uniref:glycosyltransferase 87 family protein n=1 Tax=Actinosynnema pretiosum TaxID=42197 RepID=UPI000A9EC77A|nr:glycosyltransferase 87 family protein [Actinosynnema pretiosum]
MTRTAEPAPPAAPGGPLLTREAALVSAAFAAVVTALVLSTLALGDAMPMLERDFKVYVVSGQAVLDGASPFDVSTDAGLLFIYSPFAALLFVPIALLNTHLAFALWTFASTFALTACTWLLLGLATPLAPNKRTGFALLASVAALGTAPVWPMVFNGQINLLLMLVILVDLLRGPSRHRGVAIGLAAGIKLTPLIFVPYLLLTGRARAAAVATGTFLTTVLVGYLVLPGPSGQWLSGLVLDTTRMMPPDHGPWNESLRGVLGQLPGVLHAPWFGVAVTVLVGLAGLAVAVRATRRGQVAGGVLACAVTGTLVSPVSWPHHWVWVVPGAAAWLWWALRHGRAGHARAALATWAVMIVSGVVMLLDDSPVADLVVNVISLSEAGLFALNVLPVLGGMALLVALALPARRPAGPAPDPAPEPVPDTPAQRPLLER